MAQEKCLDLAGVASSPTDFAQLLSASVLATELSLLVDLTHCKEPSPRNRMIDTASQDGTPNGFTGTVLLDPGATSAYRHAATHRTPAAVESHSSAVDIKKKCSSSNPVVVILVTKNVLLFENGAKLHFHKH